MQAQIIAATAPTLVVLHHRPVMRRNQTVECLDWYVENWNAQNVAISMQMHYTYCPGLNPDRIGLSKMESWKHTGCCKLSVGFCNAPSGGYTTTGCDWSLIRLDDQEQAQCVLNAWAVAPELYLAIDVRSDWLVEDWNNQNFSNTVCAFATLREEAH